MSVQVEVKKIPALKCPMCGSEKVSPGFNRQKGRAWVRDNNIYCYECERSTSLKTGESKQIPKEWVEWAAKKGK